MPDTYVLALDQGTTSSRAIVFRRDGRVISKAQQEFEQILPGPGLVEHDPEAIWTTQLSVARRALEEAGLSPGQIAAVGLTNQRETTVVWDRATGRAVHHAIVWQSRVSADICRRLKAEGLEPRFREKTGLLLDPYFSGTKLKYLLDTIDGLRARAEAGEVLFGTIDTFLLWRLTGGAVHATDYSNASRTLLWNIHTLDWDDELLGILGVPRRMLPEVRPSCGRFGMIEPQWLGAELPVSGIAGDQQAATFGQACFEPGAAKNTYGTGCFLLLNTGSRPVASQQLVTTVGWGIDGQVTYCLEGSVFIAGAVVQWLRDGLRLFSKAEESEAIAAQVPDTGGVFLVPAFVGLGAPYWDPDARGTIVGITRGTTAAHLTRAALESIAYQSRDLVEVMRQEAGIALRDLRVDGGGALNNLLMQFQADILGLPVRRPSVSETTALGAAYLAGLAEGYWQSLDEIRRNWQLDREFQPAMDSAQRQRLYAQWHRAVERSRQWVQAGGPADATP